MLLKFHWTMTVQEIIIYLLAAIAYFVPFYIVRYRRVNGQKIVFWFNLLFGWTLFAWIILIVVALSLKANHNEKHSLSIWEKILNIQYFYNDFTFETMWMKCVVYNKIQYLQLYSSISYLYNLISDYNTHSKSFFNP